jgi:hypothetical protein
MNEYQQRHAQSQYHGGDPELNIRQDGPRHRFAAGSIVTSSSSHLRNRLREVTLTIAVVFCQQKGGLSGIK